MSKKEKKSNNTKKVKETTDVTKQKIESTEKTQETEKKKARLRTRLVTILTIVLVIIIYVVERGKFIEVKEIGDEYLNVYFRNTLYHLIVFGLSFAFIYVTMFLTHKKIFKNLQLFFDEEKKKMPKLPNKSISFALAIVGGIVTSKLFTNYALLSFGNTWFGINDPVFNIDMSYFVFIKPFANFTILFVLIAFIFSLVYSILYSLIVLNSSFDGISRDTIKKVDLASQISLKVKAIAILLGLLLLSTMTFNIGNEKFFSIELSDGENYFLNGAGFTDATIKLYGYIILAILATISVLRTFKSIREGNVRQSVGNALIVPVYLIVLALVLAIYSAIFVGNNILEKNERYISDNIRLTKEAYALNAEYKNIDYTTNITQEDIIQNENILNNTQVVSKDNVLAELQSFQTEKGFYTYRNTQIQLYNINDVDTLCYITPREISNNNTTYNNKTYQYTHGYGVISTLAGKTDDDGHLINNVNDFGDLSQQQIKITQPRIYYGTETNSAAVINSNKTEFDYVDQDNDDDATYNYEGKAGLTLNLLDRFILGIKEGDMKLATSSSITKNSKILTNRNILNRAKTLMPYLMYDENPYMVINDNGDLYWVIDAYTTSNDFRFSQKYTLSMGKQINYIKNSVKVIINAYSGETKFYITDRNDPIAMAYNNLYPNLFTKSDEEIPQDISAHFAYSQYLFKIQADIAQQYHDIETDVYYRGNDIWEVANTSVSGKSEKIKPYYAMVKDDNGNNTLGLIIPYTIYDKQNIIGYMVATYSNGSPKVTIYELPQADSAIGLGQLEASIGEYESIASDIASLSITGNRITKNMYVVPVNNTLVYVETIYQQFINETNQKPTLKRVVLSTGNKVTIDDTMEAALNNLKNQATVDIETKNTEDMDALIDQIIKANKNVKDSSKVNDWKLFGEDLQKLTDLIDDLSSTVQQKKELESKTIDENLVNETNQVLVNEAQ